MATITYYKNSRRQTRKFKLWPITVFRWTCQSI